jgi:hypothetical protein
LYSAFNTRRLFKLGNTDAFALGETLYEDPAVVNVLLKFLKEFVQNKGQRIYFEQSSANGILLYLREGSG